MRDFINARTLYDRLGLNENTGDNFFEWMIAHIKKYDADPCDMDYTVDSQGNFMLDARFVNQILENHDGRNRQVEALSELFSEYLYDMNLYEDYEEWLVRRWSSTKSETERDLINYELGNFGTNIVEGYQSNNEDN